MSPCPICGTDCQEDWLSCPRCGWDVTPESRGAIAENPSHLYWGRSLWQRLDQEVTLNRRLAMLEQRLFDLEQRQQMLTWPTQPSDSDWLYSPLATYLSQQNWREADGWTWQRILEVAQVGERLWLEPEEIANFPQQELQALDELWYSYSQGALGWSVQADIWWESAGQYSQFCDRVGWRSQGTWLYYDDLYSQGDAPRGHFPILPWRKRSCYGVGGFTAAELLDHWMARFPPSHDGGI
ncbi:GUN4 domain-containing protein [Phormidium yuhuli AB48]|uniref:GUN4 domain-containing protein n=1 Tax=Phormidium yuhuli AB48 TaxID=2940671 RepID=A0ABY5AN83_9CYAN|nr:GUN4 domain-containing protein [Phormidium yuhuli]USR90280.1 GUN4 domain-containing protein [Phormidium yuhuli AB48]